MQREIRLKFKWIRQRRKEVLLFLEKNYGTEKDTTSVSRIENDLGITGDDASELIQKFEQEFSVDMNGLIFTGYFYDESEAVDANSFVFLLLFKLFLLPIALVALPFSWSDCKEILLCNPFRRDRSKKNELTVGDLITCTFTHKFTLQKDIAIRLI